jgi:hypothetical protein
MSLRDQSQHDETDIDLEEQSREADSSKSGLSYHRPGCVREHVSSSRFLVPKSIPHSPRPLFQSASVLPQRQPPISSIITSTPQALPSRSSSRNKLQAKLLREEIMRTTGTDALEDEGTSMNLIPTTTFGESRTRVEVLPTIDGRGRLYDVGHREDGSNFPVGDQGSENKVILLAFACATQTHSLFRLQSQDNAKLRTSKSTDNDMSMIREMLRQEKISMADQGNVDAQVAQAIMSDGKFEVINSCLSYLTQATSLANFPRTTWSTLMIMLRSSAGER